MKTNSKQVDTLRQKYSGLCLVKSNNKIIVVDVKATCYIHEDCVLISGNVEDLIGWDRVSNKIGDLYIIQTKYIIGNYSSLMLELL